MDRKDDLQEELNKASPFLADLRKKGDGFTAPKNYFKTLPDEVLKRIGKDALRAKTPVRQKRNWLDEIIAGIQFLLQPRYAVAVASVLLLIVAFIFLFQQPNEPQPFAINTKMVAIEDISFDEMNTYVAENIDDFEEDLLVQDGFSVGEMGSISNFHVEDREIENYLDGVIDEIDLSELEEIL